MLRSRAFRRHAGGARAPEHHLGLVDRETLLIVSGKAGPVREHAIDILGAATAPANDVVMVIPDPALETSGMPGGLNAAQQARGRARPQHIVDGLDRHRTELFPHARAGSLDGGVGMLGQPRQHGLARHCCTQPSRAQCPQRGAVRMGGSKILDTSMVLRFLE